MRKNLALIAVVLAAVVLFAGCRNKPPRIPARPAGADQVAPGIQATYQTVTTDPNRDDIRYVFDWDDGQDTTSYLASGDTASATHAWADTGWYAVKAKAQDAQGNWTADWSDTHMVRVAFGGGGNPPAAPAMPWGPDTGMVGEYQVFHTWAIDPDNDSVIIQFIWDDGLTSLFSDTVASGDTVTDSVVYSSRGVKNIRAVAIDVDGLLSDTSEAFVHYEDQENTAPFKPTVTGPARGIKNGPWYWFYGTAIDPQNDSVQCKFFWGDGSESDWTAFSASGVATMDSWRYATEGTYSLRCIARDQFGAVSETSDVKTFEVVGEGEILWALGFGEEFVSSPALGTASWDGRDRLACIVGVTSGYLPAIDCYQGEIIYNASELNSEEFNCSPVVGANGTVYIGNGNGVLYAYDSAGELKWSWPDTLSGDDIGATPVVDGSNLYVAGENGMLIKLTDNGSSVSEDWRFQAREEIYSSPAMSGTNVIVCDDSGYVYSVRSSDGGTNWTYLADSNNISSSPAINTDGTIYFGTEQGALIALTSAGQRSWQYEIWPFATINSSPVISADGNWVYVGADNGMVYKFNADDGTVAANWPVQVSQAGIASTPTLTADGYLYVQAEDNFLHCLSDNGAIAWSLELLIPSYDGRRPAGPRRFGVDDLLPSVALDQYGIIYVASSVDGVFAIAGRRTGTLASGPWPMFHHDVRHTGKTGSW